MKSVTKTMIVFDETGIFNANDPEAKKIVKKIKKAKRTYRVDLKTLKKRIMGKA